MMKNAFYFAIKSENDYRDIDVFRFSRVQILVSLCEKYDITFE